MGTVLLIEASEELAELIQDVIEIEVGYTILRTATCAAALTLLQHDPRPNSSCSI